MSRINEIICVSDEEISAVRRTFNKSEKDIQDDVRILLDWLDKQPHLPKPHDESLLERFLLRNKFRVEQTKVKLDNYYSFKVLHPDFYNHINIESSVMERAMKSVIFVPIPKLSPNMQRILYWEPEENQEEHFVFSHFVQFIFMMWELQLAHDYSTGDEFICNMNNFTLKHITKIDVNKLHKSLVLFQEGFSGRVCNIHYINVSPTFDVLLNMLKRVLNAKLLGKIRTHKNLESLHEAVPKECLPEEIGGKLKSARAMNDEWIKEMVLQKDFLNANMGRGSIEALRVGKVVRNDLFGIDGTFKKINLD